MIRSAPTSGDSAVVRSMLSSVRAAARLLCTFTATDRELGVSELSRRLGLSKSAVHRLLTTLAAEHLIERNPHTGRYRLGIKLYELGMVVSTHFELHEAVCMYIDDLRASTGETVHVGILDGAEVVYVERRESLRTLHHMVDLGHRNFANCTACGKASSRHAPRKPTKSVASSRSSVSSFRKASPTSPSACRS